MKALALTAALIGVVVGAAAVAASRGDKDWMTSPPEASAESFLRQLQAHRYERARPYLTDARRRDFDGRALADFQAALEGRIGPGHDVRTERDEEGERLVRVTAIVKGSEGDANLALTLRHERGEWRVDEITDGTTSN